MSRPSRPKSSIRRGPATAIAAASWRVLRPAGRLPNAPPWARSRRPMLSKPAERSKQSVPSRRIEIAGSAKSWPGFGESLVHNLGLVAAPAPHVAAQDTSGVGDVFCGVFVAHLARGAAPVEGLASAVSAASLSVTRRVPWDPAPPPTNSPPSCPRRTSGVSDDRLPNADLAHGRQRHHGDLRAAQGAYRRGPPRSPAGRAALRRQRRPGDLRAGPKRRRRLSRGRVRRRDRREPWRRALRQAERHRAGGRGAHGRYRRPHSHQPWQACGHKRARQRTDPGLGRRLGERRRLHPRQSVGQCLCGERRPARRRGGRRHALPGAAGASGVRDLR